MAIPTFSPVDPEVQENPYPYYDELRQGPAAIHLEADDLWVVSRFDHVWDIVRNPDGYSSKALRALGVGATSIQSGPRPDIRELDSKMARSLIATDPPDHTRLRRLVSRPFTPRAIGVLEERVRAICDELVDELIEAGERGEADLVTHLNFPLPVMVIAEALGIPAERRDDFKRWSNALVGQLDGAADSEANTAELKEMAAFFHGIIAERSSEPRDDLISWIIAGSQDSEDPLSARDLVAFCVLLLVAGNETTTNLLGNLYQALFDHPDQHQRVNELADLSPVIEEILRYDSSVQGILRLTNEDLTLGDVIIPQDAIVMILFGSANRDESRWTRAEMFDVDREPLDHLGFGSGIHRCLGAHLARLEMRVAIDTIRTRLSAIEPREPAIRGHSVILRGHTHMPVHLVPA